MISTTEFNAIAYSRFSTPNNSALMIASVKGKRSRKVVPRPASVSICTVPFRRSRTLCTTSSSHSTSGKFRDLGRRAEARTQDQVERLSLAEVAGFLRRNQTLRQRTLPDLSGSRCHAHRPEPQSPPDPLVIRIQT